MPRHDPADADLAICGALKNFREEAGLSQRELANLIGTQQSAISDLEQGTIPSIPLIRRICKALGLRVVFRIEKWEATRVREF